MSILIADDDTSIIVALKLLLNSEGIESEACQTPDAVLQRIRERSFQLALIDLNYCKDTTSGAEGLELISSIRKLDENLPIVVMTGWATIPLVVDAMQRGAADFVEKPWDDNQRLLNIIRTQRRRRARHDTPEQDTGQHPVGTGLRVPDAEHCGVDYRIERADHDAGEQRPAVHRPVHGQPGYAGRCASAAKLCRYTGTRAVEPTRGR
jgi:DNA-binding NtrC family response regulator